MFLDRIKGCYYIKITPLKTTEKEQERIQHLSLEVMLMIHTATSANRKTERITLAVLIAFALLLTGCQTSPEKKKLNHYNKGVEYLQKGEAQSAVLELKNAIEIDGNFADAHYQLGLAYLNLREYDKATIAFGNAASNDPTNIDARLQIANTFIPTEDYLKLNKNKKTFTRLSQ
jgi:tetratricopeptide (TPR) repeat protein